jgi:hypothetical protein
MIILFLLLLASLRSQIRESGQPRETPALIKAASSTSQQGPPRRDDDSDTIQ